MIISVVVVPAVLLLLFTVISFCGRVRLQYPFSESFHNVRLDFWLSPWKKDAFLRGGFPVSSSLTPLHFWGFIIFLGKWDCWKLVIDASGFFFFFKKFLSCKNKRKRKTCAFWGKMGTKAFERTTSKVPRKETPPTT